jgi:RNA-binding protein
MRDFTSKERSTLAKLAHDIKPVVQIGSNGLTTAVVAKIEESLKAHELIKIKFMDNKDEKEDISLEICKQCSSQLVRLIGNTTIIYRPAEKEEDRKYGITL